MSGVVRVGISGWSYPPWRGVFYPAGLRQRDELAFASRQVESIEINGSFYSLLRPSSVRAWHDAVPGDFVFAVKGSRYITHMKRLADVEAPVANFFAAGVLALAEKLGPILWQLPPAFAFDEERLDRFFTLLPRTTRAAAKVAKSHDARLEGRAYFEVVEDRPLRHAIEVRHPSFATPRFFDLLRRHRVGLCIADTAGIFPDFDEVTSDFVYVRLHGDTKLYESGYSQRALSAWAERIESWRVCADVYVYFDNDARVRAPFDARSLRAMVRGEPVEALPTTLQGAGEAARETWPAWR